MNGFFVNPLSNPLPSLDATSTTSWHKNSFNAVYSSILQKPMMPLGERWRRIINTCWSSCKSFRRKTTIAPLRSGWKWYRLLHLSFLRFQMKQVTFRRFSPCLISLPTLLMIGKSCIHCFSSCGASSNSPLSHKQALPPTTLDEHSYASWKPSPRSLIQKTSRCGLKPQIISSRSSSTPPHQNSLPLSLRSVVGDMSFFKNTNEHSRILKTPSK